MKLLETVKFVEQKTSLKPKIGIILGSGLGTFAENFSQKNILNTSEIPNYPKSNVEGHGGKIIFGKIKNIPILAFQGRVHYYESGILENVLFPIYFAKEIGIKTLIITNASGGINNFFSPGDLMLINDHINLTFLNPIQNLEKKNFQKKSYDENLKKIAETSAIKLKIKLQKGTYIGVTGPSYETASEIQMFKKIGADAVGMSTVNEVILAVNLGIKVLGISCITNLATGISSKKLSHKEVTETGNKVKHQFEKLITKIIETINV